MEFDSYTFVMLRRAPNPPELADDALERLQEAHVAHNFAMKRAGKMGAAGPLRDQDDERLRGLCFYLCGMEETLELSARDPMVQAGWLVVEAMTWLTPKGAITFHPPS